MPDSTLTLICTLTEGLYSVKSFCMPENAELLREYYGQNLPPFVRGRCKDDFTAKITTVPGELRITHYTDAFCVHYIVANTACSFFLVFGPFTTAELTDGAEETILQKCGFTDRLFPAFHLYIHSLPVCKASDLIFIAQTYLRHARNNNEEPIYQKIILDAPQDRQADDGEDRDSHDNTGVAELLEKRYAHARVFFAEVYFGDFMKARQAYKELREMLKPIRRNASPLRDKKNLAFVLNTGLRLTSERAGVHPLDLDTVSSHFAIAIENATAVQQLEELEFEMISQYCRLTGNLKLKEYSPAIREIAQYIRLHTGESIRLEDLAARNGVSPTHLSRQFNRETGLSIPNYANRVRCEKAAVMLESSRYSVDDVAYYVGFQDANYFCKIFKRQYGVTPRQYRAKRGY